MKKELLSKGPELLTDLGDHTAAVLAEKGGLPPEQAREIAEGVVNHMRAHWGGQLLYFPKGESLDIQDRDWELWEQFDGRNHDVLAKKFGLSIQQVYKRIRIMRRVAQKRDQLDIFEQHGT